MAATFTIWRKHMLKLIAQKEMALGTLFQPILWVVLFGTGMKSIMGAAIPGGSDYYISFMVPGIVALTAMSGAIEGGLTWLEERVSGVVKEYLTAPIPRLSILLGNALSTVTRSLVQALVIVLIGLAMGALVKLDPLGWLAGLALAALFSLGFAGIGLAVASRASNAMAYHMLIFMLTLPLLFVSNALYPLATMPGWMRVIARINPMSYVNDGIRQTVFEGNAALGTGGYLPLWQCFAVTLAFAVLGMLLAYVVFKKSIR